MRRWFLIATVLILALPSRAPYAGNAMQIQQTWAVLDRCHKESFVKFPDQTSEGQQQRDKYVKDCKIRLLGAKAPLGQD